MSGVTVTVSANSAEVAAVWRELTSRLRDLRRPFRDVGEMLLRSTDERFRREVAPDGTPWKPNSDKTLIRYLEARGGLSKRLTPTGGRTLTQKGARALGVKKILRDSGAMQDTIRYQVGDDYVEIGSNRVYASINQFGGIASGGARIPARPFLGVSSSDRGEVLAIFRRHLLAGV